MSFHILSTSSFSFSSRPVFVEIEIVFLADQPDVVNDFAVLEKKEKKTNRISQ